MGIVLPAPPLISGKTHTYRLLYAADQASLFMDGQHLGDFPLDLPALPIKVWLLTAARLPGDTATAEYDNFSVTGIPVGVGGVAELPNAAGTPMEARDPSGSNSELVLPVIAGAALVLSLAAGAWYGIRRRLVRGP